MAAIQIQGLYDQKQREFGTRGAGLDHFRDDFIVACNRAIKQINSGADLQSPWGTITKVDDTSTGSDADFEHVLSWGVTLHLVHMGRRPPKGSEELAKQAQSEFESGITDIAFDIINDKQNSDSDDDTYDIIGLGALG